MKNLGLKILLSVSIIIVVLAAGELVLRWRGAASSDMYKFDTTTGLYIEKPNSEYHYQSACFDNMVKANSDGFHAKEFSPNKPDDVYRIVIMGDSFVEEKAMPVEKSFAYLLEQKLNNLPDKKKKFEVYPIGIGGNGSFQNYLYLNQYGLKYKPDLVILGFLAANDFGDDYKLRSEIFDKSGQVRTKSPAKEQIINRSVLLTYFYYKWKLVENNLSFYLKNIFLSKNAASQVPFDLQVFLPDYPSSWQKIWDMEKSLFMAFKNTSAANNSKFLLVSFNDIWRAQSELLPRDKKMEEYITKFNLDFDKPEKVLTDYTQKENIPYFSMVQPLRDKIKQENAMTFLYPCDAHWNETGNQYAADALFKYLTSPEGQKLLNN